MTISLSLYKTSKPRKKGYPVAVNIYANKKRKRLYFNIYSFPEHWNYQRNEPKRSHPDFFDTAKKVDDIKGEIREIQKDFISDIVVIEKRLKQSINKEYQIIKTDFFAFTDLLIREQKARGEKSNATIYSTAKIQLQNFREEIDFEDIDFDLLKGFVNRKKLKGLKPTSIHNYLRTLRAIYNQAVQRKIITDTKPFQGVFKGLSVRSHQSRKKYLDFIDISKLEKAELNGLFDFVRDLFLLQFYFGGQDLIDIFYMKNENINHNKQRVYFKRSKVVNGYTFDLAITPKAKAILDKHNTGEEYVFEGRKSYEGYKTFRRRYSRYLIEIQKKLEIDIQPLGGNLGIKVARHSFANIGKRKGIEEDMLRELMGHERDDVDNFYKDRYPEDKRDEAQYNIINDTKINNNSK